MEIFIIFTPNSNGIKRVERQQQQQQQQNNNIKDKQTNEQTYFDHSVKVCETGDKE